jgi:outer membrane lipoprotein-sorting protein
MHDTKFNELVHLYLDDCIEQDDLLKLQSLLQESQSHREVFRDIALLHEQLSQTLPLLALPAESIRLARQVEQITLARQAEPKSAAPAPSVRQRSNRSTLALIGVVAATLVLVTLLLPSRNRSFAGSELQRILHANQNAILHYRIDVDQTSRMKKSRSKTNTDARPPKPSLHQAELFVEGSDRFVLIRTPEVGQAFITGCDGAISWAIAPQGAVRVSKDLGQFNRDIPGHEHSIPLANLKLGFEKIQKAYDVQFLAPAPDDSTSDSSDDTYKSESSGGEALLIATKHRGERGPKRIEIHYDSITGEIQQMRFVDMPYGPDQITIRLSLLDHTPVPEDFFHHTYHHSSDRTVIDESP